MTVKNSFLGKLIDLVRIGKIGFKADEVMTGTHHFVNFDNVYGLKTEELPMEFRVTWGSDNLLGFVKDVLTAKPAVSNLRGVVDIDGLCRDVPVEGTLTLGYFVNGTLCYRFEFCLGEKYYAYVGEKVNLRPWNLHKTHTTCYGKLYEVHEGGWAQPNLVLISKSVTYFRLRTAPAFVASFRLV